MNRRLTNVIGTLFNLVQLMRNDTWLHHADVNRIHVGNSSKSVKTSSFNCKFDKSPSPRNVLTFILSGDKSFTKLEIENEWTNIKRAITFNIDYQTTAFDLCCGMPFHSVVRIFFTVPKFKWFNTILISIQIIFEWRIGLSLPLYLAKKQCNEEWHIDVRCTCLKQDESTEQRPQRFRLCNHSNESRWIHYTGAKNHNIATLYDVN